MKVTPPEAMQNPTLQEFHARRCFLLGITSPEKVARLWDEERQRILAARAEEEGYQPGNRHGREE